VRGFHDNALHFEMYKQYCFAGIAFCCLVYLSMQTAQNDVTPSSARQISALRVPPLAAVDHEADIYTWKPRANQLYDSAWIQVANNGALVKTYQPAPGSAGQVHAETTFGKALARLASRPDVRRVLEIGTWYGQGSTAVIGRALKSTSQTPEEFVSLPEGLDSTHLFHRSHERRHGPKFMWTLEIFEAAWQFARHYVSWHQLPVRCVLGGTVPSTGILPPSAVDESEKTNPNSHYSLYYTRDLRLIQDSEPWLLPLCTLHAPLDAVLIDGNEYTGWAEYLVVNEVCRPRFLALHDVNTLKTQKIEAVIASNQTPWVLWEAGHDAVKWAIYVHKEYKAVAERISN
jgi:hypothetical protein